MPPVLHMTHNKDRVNLQCGDNHVIAMFEVRLEEIMDLHLNKELLLIFYDRFYL